MQLKTRYNLWKFRKSVGPSAEFKGGLRKNLDKAWQSQHGELPWYATPGVGPAMAFAVIVLLLAGGGGAYAYTSPEVTEGSVLYPVKQVIEGIEEVTKVTPEAKAEFYLKKIERREAEREILKIKSSVKKAKKNIKNNIPQNNKVEAILTATASAQTKMEAEIEEEEIKKTERSIEKAEEQLEKSGKILEKIGSQNVKLKTEIKNRIEKRREERKRELQSNNMERGQEKGENENEQEENTVYENTTTVEMWEDEDEYSTQAEDRLEVRRDLLN